MVAITRYRSSGGDDDLEEVRRYFELAMSYLQKEQARLVCIGGLSGSGKTTVARTLAPGIAATPGALHLRSDVERKLLYGVAETERLDVSVYTDAVSERVYRRLALKAKLALLAGRSVIVDAVFNDAARRESMELLAKRLNVPFKGIWLVADRQQLVDRVASRRGDASDATVDVVCRQLASDTGAGDWSTIDAGAEPAVVVERCQELLRSWCYPVAAYGKAKPLRM